MEEEEESRGFVVTLYCGSGQRVREMSRGEDEGGAHGGEDLAL